ncbi:IS30 family transposase [Lactiplantibacillus plantarum]|uniref:IS30 family transposase n=1 Tax=Lactiplantibacillus plantarum TaxID=1590 RepID=UPI0005F0A018|nr:IS30 family transposase [Lactiplantibacillus plantarum]AMO29034.1 transposase [Lactiplantibacillus plantarum]AZU40018.1 IS30 family transposase [Lactiplantibacillus plantarum]KZU84761.1 Mobile element protein [Lactiplantibacillus plantarum]MBO3685470.1 IS30 family transposase [Lactiplantibacillus plantarum]MCI3956558.1 IS30 family transposase [Lactiplantibacillus plantarum]
MSPYNHLTLKDRECILLGVTLNDTYQVIAEKIGCSKATVSREIKRNGGLKAYSAVKAQENYQGRRLKSRRPRLLTDLKLRDFVLHCIVQRQWSPEQISGRLVHENSEWHVSYNTIYRGIERDNLGIKRKNHEARGFARKLRHRGKTGRSALLTLVDRKSRYLLSQRVPKVNAKNVTQAMIDLLHTVTPKRVRTLTPDRGTEFAGYREVSQELSIPVYFPDPHAPQQRGTNENTNGLIREYFPKGTDLDQLTDQDIDKFVRDLNHRPRKVLGWKSPFEVFFGTKLRLI